MLCDYRLVGCPPFWHRKQMIMLRNIMEGKYTFTSPEWADISGNSTISAPVTLPHSLPARVRSLSANKIYICRTFFPLAEPPKDLIRKLLVVDPAQRISIAGALDHPFFQTVVSKLEISACVFFFFVKSGVAMKLFDTFLLNWPL